MRTFEVEQYELHVQKYRVQAKNEAEAVVKVWEREAQPVEGSIEFIEVAADLGLSTANNREIAEELVRLGHTVRQEVIDSIRSVEEVPAPKERKKQGNRGKWRR